jgi:hypothetical protein
MLETLEDKIKKSIKESKEALTYGELLGKCTNENPYFASLAPNISMEKIDTSGLDLFFDNSQESAKALSKYYLFNFIPVIKKFEKDGVINHFNTNQKPHATHTNIVYEDDQKLARRLMRELERKRVIAPELTCIAKEIANKIVDANPRDDLSIFQVGSSTPKNGKPFMYYGDKDRIRAVSDLDIEVYNFSGNVMDRKPVKSFVENISRNRKLPINIFTIDEKLLRNKDESQTIFYKLRYAVPLVVPKNKTL